MTTGRKQIFLFRVAVIDCETLSVDATAVPICCSFKIKKARVLKVNSERNIVKNLINETTCDLVKNKIPWFHVMV